MKIFDNSDSIYDEAKTKITNSNKSIPDKYENYVRFSVEFTILCSEMDSIWYLLIYNRGDEMFLAQPTSKNQHYND